MAHYGYAPIYEAPTDASEIIGKVYDKEIFWVIPSNENWLAVKLSNDVNGYIFYQRVKLIDDNKPSSLLLL